MVSLRYLDLHKSHLITDTGLHALTPLVALQHLDLYGTAITDVGVQALTSLVALQHLDLRGTAITDVGVLALSTALPRLVVRR